MSTTFIIEAEKKRSSVGRMMTMPTCDFGDTAVRIVDYYNWFRPNEKQYDFELFDAAAVEGEENLINS